MTNPSSHRLHWTYSEFGEEHRWLARLAYEHPPICWLQRLDAECWLMVHLSGGKRIRQHSTDAAKLEAELVMLGVQS